MTDEELDNLFLDWIENLPDEKREAAYDYFMDATAALRIIREMQTEEGTRKILFGPHD